MNRFSIRCKIGGLSTTPFFFLCLLFSLADGSAAEVSPESGKVFFERDVRPILKEHCFHCHGEDAEEIKGGLDLRLKRFLEKGGESGPAIVPGHPAKSKLLEVLKSGDMPKGKSRLGDDVIEVIEKWIASGAATARPEPETLGPGHLFTEEERSWWSLQPVAKFDPPNPGHPVDAFVLRKLKENDLSFSKEAAAETLIRRLSYDLTGLPPAPEEITAYLEQEKFDSKAAYDSLLDRLLASPAYGERWARHWLDIAGYADSDGFSEKDPERKHAWRYRDYVIRSLNNDKPYDQFIREQLAGDEIAAIQELHANSSTAAERARYEELMVATGFLRMAPDGTAVKNDLANRNACVSATMKILGVTLYGMTIGCAECHDHRYDPISQADYYRLRAIFDPGFEVNRWRVPNSRLVSLQTKEDAAKSAEIEAKAKKVDTERLAKQRQFIAEVLERELAKREEAVRAPLRTAYQTDPKKRTAEQNKLLTAHPSVKNLSAGSLYLYDQQYKTKNAAAIKKMSEEAAAIRATKPPVDYVHAFSEIARASNAVAASKVLHRGDPESPRETVSPGDLSVLAELRNVSFPEFSDQVPTTGRRLAFAESLTDGSHPFLARVIVNRVWMHHFGKGLVATAADFGVLGEKPSHPELLDWLASDFMENGWSLKHLHRRILTSQTWKQISRRTDPAGQRIDPDNRLLSRQNTRRIEAEVLRDAMLAVSGNLNRKPFGPPVPVMPNEEGAIVLGNDTTDSAGRQTGKFIPLNGEQFRRGIYVQIRRTRPLDMFAAFDAPDMMDANCEARPVTTVSPQSLLLMNNAGMRQHARHFAERLEARDSPDLSEKIDYAWRLCYGRKASDEEIETAQAFVKEQTEYYKKNPAKFERESGPAEKENAPPELLALGAFCHALLSSNEFLYID